jgi:hypothetical protein
MMVEERALFAQLLLQNVITFEVVGFSHMTCNPCVV